MVSVGGISGNKCQFLWCPTDVSDLLKEFSPLFCRCLNCKGNGKLPCVTCESRGLIKCQTCQGGGSLLTQKVAVVRWYFIFTFDLLLLRSLLKTKIKEIMTLSSDVLLVQII